MMFDVMSWIAAVGKHIC